MTLKLAIATVSDAPALAAIHAAAFPPAEAWGADVFALQLALPNVIGLHQAEMGLVLARAAAGEAEILTLGVVPPARRTGIASDLLREAIIRVAAAGAATVFLEVSVENTAAAALYTRVGFVPAGRRRRYYSDGSDALVLRLDLPASG